MIESRPMTIDDFLTLMEANKEIYKEFDALNTNHKQELAQLRVGTGTAQGYYDGDKLVAVGGIQYIGLGEAWLVTVPKIKTDMKKTLLREARNTLREDKKKLKLWRVFASSKISENFLKHLGFHKENVYSMTGF